MKTPRGFTFAGVSAGARPTSTISALMKSRSAGISAAPPRDPNGELIMGGMYAVYVIGGQTTSPPWLTRPAGTPR